MKNNTTKKKAVDHTADGTADSCQPKPQGFFAHLKAAFKAWREARKEDEVLKMREEITKLKSQLEEARAIAKQSAETARFQEKRASACRDILRRMHAVASRAHWDYHSEKFTSKGYIQDLFSNRYL